MSRTAIKKLLSTVHCVVTAEKLAAAPGDATAATSAAAPAEAERASLLGVQPAIQESGIAEGITSAWKGLVLFPALVGSAAGSFDSEGGFTGLTVLFALFRLLSPCSGWRGAEVAAKRAKATAAKEEAELAAVQAEAGKSSSGSGFSLLCVALALAALAPAVARSVPIRSIEALTLQAGRLTTGWRSAPVPQLTFRGSRHSPSPVNCTNASTARTRTGTARPRWTRRSGSAT